MMTAKATEIFRRLIVTVKTYFPSVDLLIHYTSVNIYLMHRYGTY